MSRYGNLIQELIENSCDHMTAEEIYHILKKTEPKIVQATVYNNLKQLSDKEIIRRITMPEGPDRYDKKMPHDHLVCKCCGKLKDITIPEIKTILQDHIGNGFESYTLQINWICEECSQLEN
ncbi:MAG: transcriptional repressor [Erysipelotrichaceae bacterium]|nr:transcriptional repressor [Erysipelotrichaceae bacterium]